MTSMTKRFPLSARARARARSAVSSVQPLATTMTCTTRSTRFARMDRRVRSMTADSLCAGMTTLKPRSLMSRILRRHRRSCERVIRRADCSGGQGIDILCGYGDAQKLEGKAAGRQGPAEGGPDRWEDEQAVGEWDGRHRRPARGGRGDAEGAEGEADHDQRNPREAGEEARGDDRVSDHDGDLCVDRRACGGGRCGGGEEGDAVLADAEERRGV